jgi:hypothetical protein
VNGRAQRFRFLPLAIAVVVVLLAGGGLFWAVRSFLNSAPAPAKKVVQEIHVIRPPPPPPEAPPPPPPPPEEKVDVQQPDQAPDPTPSNDPPPSEQLGLDAEGGAGGDAFGLVGHAGGHELLASGGSAYAWYGNLLKDEILARLENVKEAHKGAYSVSVKVWVRSDGTVERAHLAQSTGDRERDKAIELELSHWTRVSQAPPPNTPLPISVRLTSRA